MSTLRARSGFTLIELLVVIVILAILMAIAIPTLLGQRKKAWNSSAQSDVTNAYKSAKAEYTTEEAYFPTTNASVATNEPGLNVVSGLASSAGQSSTNMGYLGDQSVVLAKQSKSGVNYILTAVESGGGAGVVKNW